MRNMWLLILIVPTLLLGCASIVETGQTRGELDEAGALRWALTEYDYAGSRYVWIPHWNEGLLHVSSPSAHNCKKLDVLQFDTHDNEGQARLTAVYELGADRAKWADVLKRHGRIKTGISTDNTTADPLYVAVTERIVREGMTTECVLFAAGFPSYGPMDNPRVKRTPYEIKKDDVLYYLTSRFGTAQEIVLEGGRVVGRREAEHADGFWLFGSGYGVTR